MFTNEPAFLFFEYEINGDCHYLVLLEIAAAIFKSLVLCIPCLRIQLLILFPFNYGDGLGQLESPVLRKC